MLLGDEGPSPLVSRGKHYGGSEKDLAFAFCKTLHSPSLGDCSRSSVVYLEMKQCRYIQREGPTIHIRQD